MRIFDVSMELDNDEGGSIVKNEAVISAPFNRRVQKKTNLMFKINQACLYVRVKLCSHVSGWTILNYTIKHAREKQNIVYSNFFGNHVD